MVNLILCTEDNLPRGPGELVAHSHFQISTLSVSAVDHSDGRFFKMMEWSMVFEKKPL